VRFITRHFDISSSSLVLFIISCKDDLSRFVVEVQRSVVVVVVVVVVPTKNTQRDLSYIDHDT